MNEIKAKKKSWLDYIFCLLVGGIYLYAVMRGVLSATVIRVGDFELYLIGLISITFFMLVLFNGYTRIIFLIIVLVTAFWVFFTMYDVTEQYPHLYEVFLMITGHVPYQPELGRTVVFVIGILLGFVIVVFMLHQFSFYMLGISGAAVFLFTWMTRFARDEVAFVIFLAAFLIILVRNNNRSLAVPLAAAPLCIAVVLITNFFLPNESDLYVRRYINQPTERFLAVNDFFYEMFNPVHFSFQTTGFSGAGGRLGGPIAPNNRYVMTVTAPGRVYLSGAVSDTYTGYRWLPTIAEGDVYTHGLPPAQFEMMETAAALIRGATHSDFRTNIQMIHLDIPPEEVRRINARQFPTIGVSETIDVSFYVLGSVPFLSWGEEPSTDVMEMHLVEVIDSMRHFLDVTADEDWEGAFEQRSRLDANLNEAEFFLRNIENTTARRVVQSSMNTYYWHTYMPFSTVSIQQGTNRMGTIFRPPNVMNISFDEPSFDYLPFVETSPLGDMQIDSFMSRGAAYTMQFLNVDSQLSFIEYILRGTNSGVYENEIVQRLAFEYRDWPIGSMVFDVVVGLFPDARPYVNLPQPPLNVHEFAALLEFYSSRGNSVSYINDPEGFITLLNSFRAEVLAPYAQQVRQHFLGVPEIVPQRVWDLTMEIVYGIYNDFERVTAIRDYLLQFPYTMDTQPVPRGVCFVDWFLFEERQGYCTYFASAMAIMSRIAGVPSRYVEGFVLPPSQNPALPVIVTNRMAHAWVEVYLEGFGWHIIEATPTYAYLMSLDMGTPHESNLTGEIMERVNELFEDFIPPFSIYDFIQNNANQNIEPVYDEENENSSMLIFIIVIAVICIITALICFRLKERRKLARINNLPLNEQVKIYFHSILGIVTYYTSPLTPHETPKSYSLRMGKRFAFRSDSVFLRDIISLYYKARYSPAQLSEDEVNLMKEAHRDMIALLRYTRQKYVFAYLRYVRGIGGVKS
ncbi:MAG: hypothetical protein FWF81_05970 [Defluviitaleaceae bacterium]|nr:hypothetical protein [Defluviitaleaceae bacterium]